jgi:hypothetical protein
MSYDLQNVLDGNTASLKISSIEAVTGSAPTSAPYYLAVVDSGLTSKNEYRTTNALLGGRGSNMIYRVSKTNEGDTNIELTPNATTGEGVIFRALFGDYYCTGTVQTGGGAAATTIAGITDLAIKKITLTDATGFSVEDVICIGTLTKANGYSFTENNVIEAINTNVITLKYPVINEDLYILTAPVTKLDKTAKYEHFFIRSDRSMLPTFTLYNHKATKGKGYGEKFIGTFVTNGTFTFTENENIGFSFGAMAYDSELIAAADLPTEAEVLALVSNLLSPYITENTVIKDVSDNLITRMSSGTIELNNNTEGKKHLGSGEKMGRIASFKSELNFNFNLEYDDDTYKKMYAGETTNELYIKIECTHSTADRKITFILPKLVITEYSDSIQDGILSSDTNSLAMVDATAGYDILMIKEDAVPVYYNAE